MEDNNLYTSHNLAILIKGIAKQRNIVIKDMLNDCDLGSNTMSSLYHGKQISFSSLAKIADYLNCSVDYLLGRTNNPDMSSRLPELTKEEWDKIELFAQGLIASRK
mgnify:FL=1